MPQNHPTKSENLGIDLLNPCHVWLVTTSMIAPQSFQQARNALKHTPVLEHSFSWRVEVSCMFRFFDMWLLGWVKRIWERHWRGVLQVPKPFEHQRKKSLAFQSDCSEGFYNDLNRCVLVSFLKSTFFYFYTL